MKQEGSRSFQVGDMDRAHQRGPAGNPYLFFSLLFATVGAIGRHHGKSVVQELVQLSTSQS